MIKVKIIVGILNWIIIFLFVFFFMRKSLKRLFRKWMIVVKEIVIFKGKNSVKMGIRIVFKLNFEKKVRFDLIKEIK